MHAARALLPAGPILTDIAADTAANTIADLPLRDALAAWLDADQTGWAQRFPAALAARFEADCGRPRSRHCGLIILAATLSAAFLWALLGGVPASNQAASRAIFLQGAVPFSAAMGILLLTRPAPFLRELALALTPSAFAGSMFVLFMMGHYADPGVLVGGSLLLLNFAAIALQIRFGYMLGFTALLMGGFAATIERVANLPSVQGWNLWLETLIAAGFMLLANWRLHAEQRRNYALILREKLRLEDLSQQNETLDALVRSDALTGLANRRGYDAWLHSLWLQARASQLQLGLIIVDIDRFKAYNDFYGHAEGDACLQAVARSLREQLRGTSDMLARFGGEEFAVLLPGLDAERCGNIAERLRLAVEALELPHLGTGGTVTLSCGAASLPAAAPFQPADLFAAADAALYAAKDGGRNRVCIASPPAPAPAAVMGSAQQAAGNQHAARQSG